MELNDIELSVHHYLQDLPEQLQQPNAAVVTSTFREEHDNDPK